MRVGSHPSLPELPEDDPVPEEPKLPTGKDFNHHPFGALKYAPVAGRPIISGIAPDDVVQGNLGDCFFMSSLVALARTKPKAIEDALKVNPDGSYTVTFRGPGGRPAPVTVDGAFPTKAGAQPFGRGLDKAELWPAIFEKAYAKWKGGYGVIDGGGFAKDALGALTGKPAHSRTLSTLSGEAAWKLVKDAVRAGQPVVTGTPDLKDLKKRTAGRPAMDGLIDGHAYALLDAYEKNGRRFVKLYTPLSPADAEEGTPGEPRTIELPFERWKAEFDDVAVGTV
ncbi:MAG TPA: C2 family cysteine protease [Planctomycetota bacterium]|nr:C2 family cysteine protease [Planctomycetota bacterium]